ncbi:putative hydroxyindole O-methyltransferase [Melanomma pulvis-pyrius CBS 109.77]|uniref:Putative hydroxyindole O-methyltransferase n=1 Tax=Melanomma pulvis-pyrius CBS 109.77 TaxID=1314802 RepID=A0A6A6XVQ9_9PLEO|nr:putative hydroxyindole O-methyltransferase [Melanomma pulvis-pyrius CBS 109.77]
MVPSVLQAQAHIVEACTELQALVEAPLPYLMRVTSPRNNALWIALHTIYRFNITTHLSLSEELSFSELAQRCGMEESDLRRVIRTAISHHVFLEPRKGFVAHSATSRLIAENELVQNWLGFVCEDHWPQAVKAAEAFEKWPGSQETDQVAFQLANAGGMDLWETLKTDEKRQQRFNRAMVLLQSHPAVSVEHLFTFLGWDSEHWPRTVVDIGGNQGKLSIDLLRRYPQISCCVQDLPSVVDGAKIPEDLTGRLTFTAHDFFTEQPRKNADVYYFRAVLHDWSNKYVVLILKNLIPALKDGARVIINEMCLPEPGVLHFHYDQLLRGYDLTMKTTQNGAERDATEWEKLFQSADRRFKLLRVESSPDSMLSMIEFCWNAEDNSTIVAE